VHESAYLSILLVLTAGTPEATGSSGWNVPMTNGGVEYLVRFDADLFPELPVSQGLNWKISGIGGQFDNESPYFDGYQIIPQSLDDVEVLGSIDLLDPAAFSIYPNPVSDRLIIKGERDIEYISIYDIAGRQVMLVDAQNYVETGHLDAGSYVVKIKTDDGIWSGKFIKQAR
jgi:hypothetical protein